MRLYPTVLSEKKMAVLHGRKSYTKYAGKCPTCQDKGTYRFNDTEYECPKDEDGICIQTKLFRFYELANIPQTYQRLNWNADFVGQDAVQNDILAYIASIDSCLLEGVGMTFYSTGLGTGKTFCATHILKEIVKKRKEDGGFYSGYYIGFHELMNLYQVPENEAIMKRLLDSDIIVIDDIIPGKVSEKQREFYAASLERVIRKRVENSTPILVTTNMVPKELQDAYNRIFSLLADRNVTHELRAEDTRISKGYESRIIRAFANEIAPIS